MNWLAITGKRAVVLTASLLFCLGGCGNAPVPTAAETQASSPSVAAIQNPDPKTCPEMMVATVPGDLRLSDRMIVPSGPDPAGVRVQYTGPDSRELTFLSGVAGEIPRGPQVRQVTVRNHAASVSSSGSDAFVVRWLEAAEGAPCSQYAVVAAGLLWPEVEAVLSGLR